MAQKAGKLISGEDMCIESIRSGKAFLVLVAGDASLNTKKLFNDKCTYRNVTLKEFETKEILGKLIGKENRAVVAVVDKGFSDAMLKLFENIN